MYASVGDNLMDQLLGLKQVSWSDPQTALQWQRALPAWAWALLALAVVAFSAWSYYKLLGWRLGRMMLTGVRAMLILLIIALLCGPMLVLPRERVEPDTLLVLFDRSASINIADMGDDLGRLSRDQALRLALKSSPDLFSAHKLGGAHRRILWLGFDNETFELTDPIVEATATNDQSPRRQASINLPQPDGATTAIRTALEQALQRAAGRPIAGVILFTDGRSPEATGADLVRRLNQQGVSVFPVALGAKEMSPDLAVGRVDYPQKAFINDLIPVTVWIESYGPPEIEDQRLATVRLFDDQTNELLDEKVGVEINSAVRLQTQSKTVGPVRWRVEIAGDDPSQREVILDNNRQTFSLDLVDRPIRVLLVDGYPRWEFRYLKNLLIREKSIAASTLLLSADRNFAQEGDIPIKRMPANADEIEPFDVIVIGDAPSRYFGADLMGLIRDHVAVRGAGLLWIGGEYFTPRSYTTTPLAEMLPMRDPGAVQRLDPALGELTLQPTELAKSLGVLRIRSLNAGPEQASDDWPDELTPLRWAQDLGVLKPTAEALVESQPLGGSAGTAPVVVRLHYGAGQSLYVATDEIWRWRYGRGEFYFEQFWVPLLRLLGRHRLQQDEGAVRLDISRKQAQRGQAVVVDLAIYDELLLERHLPSIRVAVTSSDQPDVASVQELELLPLASNAPDAATLSDPLRVHEGVRYQAVWEPRVTGRLRLRIIEPGLFDLDLSREIDVFDPDDENRQPLPDHDRLQYLADQTDGQMIALTSLDQLSQLVPRRELRSPNDIRETIWDSYLALALVILLATIEWVGRKLIRLV